MLRHPNIDPVALHLGPLSIHWYGLMYLLGFWGAWRFGLRRAQFAHVQWSRDRLSDLIFYVVMGVIIGGRVGYVLFYAFDADGHWLPLADPMMIVRVWQGGMSFHGGLIGVLIAMGVFARVQKLAYFEVADFAAVLVPIGLFTGRIGNFINGELWGKPTELPWGMVFETAPDLLPRHPSMLYEALLEGLVMFAVLWWVGRRPTPRGVISALFLLLYGTFRFLVEFVRVPDAQLGYQYFGWLTRGQELCLPMLLAGTLILIWALRRKEASEMRQYLDLMQHVLEHGTDKSDRTGTGTRSVFGHQMRFDLRAGFPLLTTKKLHLKSITYELLWFLRGETNTAWLKEHGVSIWDEWADANGELGPVYGKQWRSWPTPDGRQIDQIQQVLQQLRSTPDSRRIIVSAWNVGELDKMALMPCHALFQFYVADGRLSCQLYQRSADIFLGVPFNIASYALLTMMVAQVCDLQLGDFVWTGGDCHLYSNHFEQARLQLSRDTRALPQMTLNPEVRDLFAFRFEDFTLSGYDPHPHIKAPVAV